jgi:hypothetical protein
MERLKNDLEGEVNNSEKLNNALSVSKALVNNLKTKYAEAVEQVNHSAKTFVKSSARADGGPRSPSAHA